MRFAGLRRGPRRAGRRRFRLRALTVIVLALFLAGLAAARAIPVTMRLAEISATDAVTVAVNDAIRQKMTDGSLAYEELVTLEKDRSGCVTALVTNVARTNLLQAEISGAIIENLSSYDAETVYVPVGNLLGVRLFSAYGPAVPIRILSFSNVNTSFTNVFTSAGINQTRHQIMLNVVVSVTLLMPGCSENIDIPVEVQVAETVIVGSVPGTYAEF